MIRIAIVEDDAQQEKELSAYLHQYFGEINRPISVESFSSADLFLNVFVLGALGASDI